MHSQRPSSALTQDCSDICYVRLTDTGVLAPKHGAAVGMVEAGLFYGDYQDGRE